MLIDVVGVGQHVRWNTPVTQAEGQHIPQDTPVIQAESQHIPLDTPVTQAERYGDNSLRVHFLEGDVLPFAIPAWATAHPLASERSEISRPISLHELLGNARCVPCIQQARRCHVEQGATSCLQCNGVDVCIFERVIRKKGRPNDFTWSDLIGVGSNFGSSGIDSSAIEYRPGSSAIGSSAIGSSGIGR
jgi:hypothetical protein